MGVRGAHFCAYACACLRESVCVLAAKELPMPGSIAAHIKSTHDCFSLRLHSDSLSRAAWPNFAHSLQRLALPAVSVCQTDSHLSPSYRVVQRSPGTRCG